jgi:TetR/AcrR family transcriptional regulator, cholesterol catabolism regulator
MKRRKQPSGNGDRFSRLSAEHIYRTAAELFYAKGFDATSMDDIARAVEATKAGLYYHIDSKEDLLFGIMKLAMDHMEEFIIAPARAETEPEVRLRLLIRFNGRRVLGESRALSIVTDELVALTPEHRRHIETRMRVYFDLMRSTLDELKAAGKLRNVNTTVATFSLFGTLMWLPRWHQQQGSLSVEKVLDELTEIRLGGLIVTEPAASAPTAARLE